MSNIKSILILVFLVLIIWLPSIYKLYNPCIAMNITLSTIIAGMIGDYIRKKKN